jgi:hypothetical protein
MLRGLLIKVKTKFRNKKPRENNIGTRILYKHSVNSSVIDRFIRKSIKGTSIMKNVNNRKELFTTDFLRCP